jgi:hypothetical protein
VTGDEGRYLPVGRPLGAEAYVVRLSLLYALLDCSAQVKLVHLQATLTLRGYIDRSAHLIFGDSLGDPSDRWLMQRARLLHIAMRSAGATAGPGGG